MIASLRRALVFLLTVGLLSAGPASIGSVDTGFGAAPLRAQSSENSKYAAIVVDASTGEVLFDRFADARRYPASTTKMMTLYLTFEALEQGKVRLDDVLTVTSHAASQPPSKLGLGAGQSITLDNAMRATAVRSANDMAVALAEHIGGGSESRFTAMMTLKAQELGMTQTRYVNANGLPDGRQVTSARDLSILARAIMRDYPQYYRYFGLHDWAYNGRDYRNTNGLLATGRGYDGMKTGYINASGYNLVASAVRDGRRIITVVLGGRSSASRNAHVAELMDTGFELERRREAGERIQIAQTFFEQRGFGLGSAAADDAPIAYASASDEDGGVPANAVAYTAAPAPTVRPTLVADAGSTARAWTPSAPRPAPAPVQAQSPAQPQTQTAPRVAETRAASTTRTPAPRASSSAPRNVTASLNGAPPGAAVAPSTTPRRPPASTTSAPAPRTPAGRWAVQVGAFKDQDVARDWLTEVNRRFRAQFASAEQTVVNAGGWYRSRFTNLSEAGAQSACAALAERRVTCMVIRPS